MTIQMPWNFKTLSDISNGCGKQDCWDSQTWFTACTVTHRLSKYSIQMTGVQSPLSHPQKHLYCVLSTTHESLIHMIKPIKRIHIEWNHCSYLTTMHSPPAFPKCSLPSVKKIPACGSQSGEGWGCCEL